MSGDPTSATLPNHGTHRCCFSMTDTRVSTFSKLKLSQFICLLPLVSSLESIFSAILYLSETELLNFSSLCTSGGISGSQLLADFSKISSSLCICGGKNARLYIYILTDLDFCFNTHAEL